MIANYTPPQHLISLALQTTAAATVPRSAALIIGNQYLLSRYGEETNVPTAVYAARSAEQALAWRYRNAAGTVVTLDADEHTVDLASARLHGIGLEATLATSTAGSTTADERFFVDALATPSIIRMGTTGSHNNVAGSDLAAILVGRDVTVGDLAYVTHNSLTRRRRVTALKGVAVAASYGANTAHDNGLADNASINPPTVASDALTEIAKPANWAITIASGAFAGTLAGPTYLGSHGDSFVLTVTTGGLPGTAVVSMSSASGAFSDDSITTVDDSGNFQVPGVAGMTILLDPPGGTTTLTAGQVFSFSVLGAYTRLSSTSSRLLITGTYTGATDTTLVAKVVTGTTGDTATGGVLEISDTSGLLEPSQISLTNNVASVMGLGLSITISLAAVTVPQDGLRKGDIYLVHAVAATESTDDFDRVILDGPAVDLSTYLATTTELTVEFRKEFTGVIAPTAAADEEAWTADAEDGITVQAGLSLYVEERTSGSQWVPFVNSVGTLAVSFRALALASATDTLVPIDSTSDIVSELGSIDLDNDLAFGVSCALARADGNRVFALNIGGVTDAAFAAALRKLESSDNFSYIGLASDMTDAAEAKKTLRTHCITMSGETKRNFRKCYVGTDMPGAYAAIGVDPDTDLNYTATIEDAGGGEFLTVRHTSDTLDFTALNLAEGDLYTNLVSDVSYEIDEILSATELRLKTGPVSAVVVAQAFMLTFANTVASQKRFLQETAAGLGSHFCTNIVQATAYVNTTDIVPARFVACEIAGLRSGTPSQQGLSRQALSSITSIPGAYTTWTPDDWDDVAAAGNLVVTQDIAGGPCYIRHQLTTNSSDGELYYEDNALAVLFEIGFQIKDSGAAAIGRKNVTSSFLALREAELRRICEDASKEEGIDDDAGPLIAGFRNVAVAQDSVLRNRVNESVEVAIALPLNTLYTRVLGYVNTVAA